MYCKKCGAELPDDARFCTSCGFDQTTDRMPGQRQEIRRQPSNYLWLGILVTLLCCMPFGIVSIVYASKVDSCFAAGNIEEAFRYSSKAKAWALWGIGLSLVLFLIYIIIFVLILGYDFMEIGDYSLVNSYENVII